MGSQSKGIVVVGMHRSGTSALSGELSNLGVFMGKKLFKAQKGVNEKGFWENARLVKINEMLLEAANSDWDDPTGLSRLSTKYSEKLFRTACNFVETEYTSAPLWGMKDPRTSMLLPFWRSVLAKLNITPNIILMLRHPLEVAASLTKRDGFSQRKGLVLWLNYNFSSYLHTSDYPRLIVDFSDLLESPMGIREKISEKFGLSFDYREPFIDKKLKRSEKKNSQDSTNSELDSLALKLYESILKDDEKAVSALYDAFIAIANKWEPVLLEHLEATTRSEIHFRTVFESAYRTFAWKISSPLRKLEQKVSERNEKI